MSKRLDSAALTVIAEGMKSAFRGLEAEMVRALTHIGAPNPTEDEVLELYLATYFRHRIELSEEGRLYGSWGAWAQDRAGAFVLSDAEETEQLRRRNATSYPEPQRLSWGDAHAEGEPNPPTHPGTQDSRGLSLQAEQTPGPFLDPAHEELG